MMPTSKLTATDVPPAPCWRCGRAHLAWQTFGRCRFGQQVAWVHGEGRYAVRAGCGFPAVWLYPTMEAAKLAKQRIDTDGCGGQCGGRHRHRIIDLAK